VLLKKDYLELLDISIFDIKNKLEDFNKNTPI
jgi:hypothetical protein